MKFKKFIIIILSCLLISSCNNEGTGGKIESDITIKETSSIINSSSTLTMGYTDKFKNFPEKCGYKISNKEITYEEFALYVLSGDRDYDVFLINTRQRMTDSIRTKGYFYPLNEVDGVNEYINKIFPYVKDATINNNGEIWGLPNSLETLSFNYNEKLWNENKLDIKNIKCFEDIIKILTSVKNENIDENYSLSGYVCAEKYFYQIININNGFDKEDFKNMAEYFYNNINYVKGNAWYFENTTTKTAFDSVYGSLLNMCYGISFSKDELNDEPFLNLEESWNDFLSGKLKSWNSENYVHNRYMAFPPISESNKNDVTCEFVCVNPNSSNLDLTLSYLSDLSKFKMNEKNSFILNDKSTYGETSLIEDFYYIYGNNNNYIRFGLNWELFFEDFEKYLADEITLDEYLNRVEYKINAYLNE